MVVISIGFYGVKGGGWVLLTGGGSEVQGPDSTGLTDRNHMALALVMTLPLINYLRQQSENVWVRRALLAAAALHVFAIVGTYSRGGLLALAATLGMMFIRARGKLWMLLFAMLAAPAAFYFMPETWWERMASIQDYQEDVSAQSRLDIWRVCLQIGLSSIFGGGFLANAYSNIVWQYDPTVAPRAAHSIFMEVLAEQGVIGLAIWSAMMVVGVLNARWLVRAARARPNLAWASDLGRMSQASLVGYFVAGAFLSLGYWIQELLLLVILCGARRLVTAELRASRKTAPATGLLGIPTPSAVAR
jgi:probable O-glycosylation ligase (exosortase A-associated)